MQPTIYLQPKDAWQFFTKNMDRLSEELVEIANNNDTKTSVYMTEENGQPYLYVYRNDKKVFQFACKNVSETERNLRLAYDEYLEPIHDSPACDDDDDLPPCDDLDAMSESEFQDMVNEREDVIFSAVFELIEVLTEDEGSALEFDSEDDDYIEHVIDHIVEYLAINCGFRIRRPMELIDDETGCVVRTEYPYEEYEFREDELHP